VSLVRAEKSHGFGKVDALHLRLRFPHPLTLLVGFIGLAAVMSYVLPAGQFDRRDDPVTGRKVVVAGTYHTVPQSPVTPFQAVVAIPKGLAAAGPVIFLVFLIGGAFGVVDQTGALRRGVEWMVQRLRDRELLVIPIVCLAFGTAGALDNMHEEIIPLVPVLLLLTTRLGFDPLVAAAMSMGAAGVGSAFSPINPFQVGIAQKLAGLPLLSASGFRLVFLALALALWIAATSRYARATRTARLGQTDEEEKPLDIRDGLVLITILIAFAIFVVGVMKYGWDFDQMSALFFIMGIVVGQIGGLGIGRTAEAFIEGFRSMAFAAMLIGFARAIFVVAEQGQVIDTIVNGLFAPLSHFPLGVAAAGMMVAQFLVHFPVPSVTGHAVLTLPVLVPLSDLLGLSRQVTVLAYQYGGGLCDLVTPTSGGLMAILAASKVPYGKWIRFLAPVYAGLFLLGLVAVGIAIVIRLS
jgi:uncharacterized ion transporter superfamily protein YfcC